MKSEISFKYTNVALLCFTVTLIVLVVDVMSVRIIIIQGSKYSVDDSVLEFSILLLIFAASIFLGLGSLRFFTSSQKQLFSKFHFNIVYYLSLLSLIITTALICVLSIQALYYSTYSIILLSAVTISSAISSILLLSFLVVKIFVWFRTKKDKLIFIYSIAIISIIINYVIISILIPSSTASLGNERRKNIASNITTSLGLPTQLFEVFRYASYVSFTLMWIATIILLKNYSRNVGPFVYYIVVSIPMLYFIGQTPQIFSYVFSGIRFSEPDLYFDLFSLLFGVTRVVGGVFFAIGFWIIARNVKKKEVKAYLRFLGLGIVFIFVSTQIDISVPRVSILYAPYPPFGVMAISSSSVGSFLTFIGLYFTAISVAKDRALRMEITKRAESATFLAKIATAQMEDNLMKEVKTVIDKLSEESEEVVTSYDEQDVKLMVKEALEQVRKREGIK